MGNLCDWRKREDSFKSQHSKFIINKSWGLDIFKDFLIAAIYIIFGCDSYAENQLNGKIHLDMDAAF